MRKYGVNEYGFRVGEDHYKAKLTNAEVELLLTLRDEAWTYAELALKFEVSKSTVAGICSGRRRCQVAVKWIYGKGTK